MLLLMHKLLLATIVAAVPPTQLLISFHNFYRGCLKWLNLLNHPIPIFLLHLQEPPSV